MTYPPSNKEFLKKETFKCTKCGECCRPVVYVSEDDIKRIEESGKERKDFVRFDEKIKSNILLQVQGVCSFLKREGDYFVCSIYDSRPEVCRKYPFMGKKLKDCRPKNWKWWMDIKDVVQSK